MNEFFRRTIHTFPAKTRIFVSIVISIVTITLFGFLSNTTASTPITLGTAGNFGLLAGAGITSTGAGTIGGDVGSYPTTSITGIPGCNGCLAGTNHHGDSVTQTAKTDLQTAMDNISSYATINTVTSDLGGKTLSPGVYVGNTPVYFMSVNGILTLNGGGNPNSIFIFKAVRLSTGSSGTQIKLINGANACNVYWDLRTFVVVSSVNIGAGTNFYGTVLTDGNITVNTGTIGVGGLLTSIGKVTITNSNITVPSCGHNNDFPTPTPTPTPSQTVTPSPTPTPSQTVTVTPTPTPSPTPSPTTSLICTTTSSGLGPATVTCVQVTPTPTPTLTCTAPSGLGPVSVPCPSTSPTPSPTPSTTSTSSPSPTPSATPTVSVSPSSTPSPSSNPSPSVTPTSSAVPTPTPSITPTTKPTVKPTVKPTTTPTGAVPSPTPTPSAVPTDIPVVQQILVKPKGFVATDNGTATSGNFLAPSTPMKISIASIGVTSSIIKLGLLLDGTLQVPTTGSVAGWYNGSPTPGEVGPSIIVAHVDMGGKLGIFFHLKDLKIGAKIDVLREDGTTAVFAVTEKASYLKSQFPTEKVYGNINFAGLRLITCGGKFDSKTGHYLSNIVVFAKAISN